MKKILFLIFFAMVVSPIGCDRLPRGFDESNIEKVIEAYYTPGKPCPSGKEIYRFLSSKSQIQITEEQYIQLASRSEVINSAQVIRKENNSGITYAIVSWEAGRGEFKEVNTRTWILEGNRWRFLIFPKTQEEVRKNFENGDYTAAKAKAEEWLSLDPFSIVAYHKLAFSLERSPAQTFMSSGRSLNDIVRAVLAINENDSTALFLAVTATEDSNIAKTFLKRMEGHFGYESAASNLARRIADPNKRLSFLEDQMNTHLYLFNSPSLLMLRLFTLAQLKRWEDFKKISNMADTSSPEQRPLHLIKKLLDESDPSFAALHAGMLGSATLESGDRKTAQKWLEYGVTRDPNNGAIKTLAASLSR